MTSIKRIFSFSLFLILTSCLTGVYPPIKTYHFTVGSKVLSENITGLMKKDSTLRVRMRDTVGTPENGYAYYMDVTFKDPEVKYWYTLKYEDDHENIGYSALKVIMASDSTNWIICYKKTDKGALEFLDTLERKLISKIETTPGAKTRELRPR